VIIIVHGEPAPQGSKSFKGYRGGKAILVESSKKLKPWREAIVIAAKEVMSIQSLNKPGFSGPVVVSVEFYRDKPKSAKKKVWPDTKPDIDKLVRAVLDALTIAEVIKDDSLVVDLRALKYWVGKTQSWSGLKGPGAVISIRSACL
jgi:crossover junction endodeoxyribonuclease RusA